MNSPPNREVALFSVALELPANRRAAYLDTACADDPALRLRLEALLRVHEEAIPFLETPAAGAQEPPMGAEVPDATVRFSNSPAEKAGDRIGRYKLLQQIGEGGCGVVYMAEQEEPVRRPLALKVIKLGMDTKQVVARFEAERQALALMDHPNIAKVFDAGTTETGRPFFVMELVKGIPITRYCDENCLSTEQRLRLFVLVCQAIQHAHQKGIIHRDIKPSNILVADHDGVPVPKIIDFGIAKATTDQRLTDKTLFTAFEQFMGTPAYMSPEQAKLSGLDIDTRSDIYSLGVLLYELLTGTTPFDTKALLAAGLDEIRRTIREVEPVKPSTRLTQVQGARAASSGKSEIRNPQSEIDPDLDWIVMKALEKERARRYETANGLATDILRHLNCEPVVARPPSRLYEFQKTVRRHKLGFAAGAALITVLAVGALVNTSEAIRATRAERDQSRLRQQAEQAGNTAKRQEQLARESADEARRQQRLASEQELLARRRFYAAQMNLANQAIEAGQLGRALGLLETQRPKSALEDLRTFEWYHLWGMCNAHLRGTLRGHKQPVYSVAISPDGKTLASASEDSTIRFWEISTGRNAITLNIPAGNAECAVVFTPDGKTLAAGGDDGLVRLWDVASGKLRARLPARGWIRSLAISPHGSYLVCGCDEGVQSPGAPSGLLRILDLATGAEQMTLSAHQGPVMSIAFSRDGNKVASVSAWGTDDGTTRLWDMSHGHIQPQLQVAVSGRALAFSPDGKMLAVATWEDIYIGDTATGQLQATLKGHSPRIRGLAWLPDGRALVSCASDRTIRLWPTPPTNSVVTESEMIGEHLSAVMCLAISTDGTTLASGANDGSVKLWNLSQTQEQTEAQVASHFEIGTGSTNGYLTTLLFSPDGKRLFGVREHLTAARDIVSGLNYPVLLGAGRGGALSPDGKLLATGDNAGLVKLWDHASGRLLVTIKAHTSEIVTLAFSPDGRMLVTGGFGDPVLKAWDPIKELKPLWETDTEGAGISSLAFSPDGKRIAAIVRLTRVDFFDASTGRRHYGFEVERGYAEAYSLAFSPDGKLLAVGNESGIARLWDLEKGRWSAALQGHTALIRAVAFSPDGGTLATGSADRTVRLWDVATGQERVTLRGFQDVVGSVAFSPDGNTLAAGSLDGLVYLWRANRVAEATAYAEQNENNPPERDHGAIAQLTLDRLHEEKFAEAEGLARECLAIRERDIPDDWRTFNARSMLGGALLGQTKYADAEPMLLAGYEGMKQREDKIPPAGKPRLRETLQRLSQLYEATNRPDQAAGWKRKLAEFAKTEK